MRSPFDSFKVRTTKKSALLTVVVVVIIALLCLYSLLEPEAGKLRTPEPNWEQYYTVGEAFYNAEGYKEAVIALKIAIDIDPYREEAYLLAAKAYIADNDTDSAKRLLEQGFELTQSEILGQMLAEIKVK